MPGLGVLRCCTPTVAWTQQLTAFADLTLLAQLHAFLAEADPKIATCAAGPDFPPEFLISWEY